MSGVFAGVRVIELAQFVYVPGAAVLMADQGAEVIKIETIEGDPYRTLQVGGSRNLGNVNISMEQNNRNKKSVALDLKSEEGREALLKLVETADVFLTSLRPKAIQALRLDVEDLRARNPRIIYARGNGVGFRGPEANRPGYDGSVFWARGGNCYAFTRPGEQPTNPRPAYGDHTGSIALAFGIAGALFKRATTGEAPVVENSLLATSCWVLSGDLTQTQLPQYQTHPETPIRRPLTYSYETRDGKRVQLMIPEPAAALGGAVSDSGTGGDRRRSAFRHRRRAQRRPRSADRAAAGTVRHTRLCRMAAAAGIDRHPVGARQYAGRCRRGPAGSHQWHDAEARCRWPVGKHRCRPGGVRRGSDRRNASLLPGDGCTYRGTAARGGLLGSGGRRTARAQAGTLNAMPAGPRRENRGRPSSRNIALPRNEAAAANSR